ncbi:hypothetical protein [Rugosimonospora africana]|uniref:Uncharacterized protein n=1 Tax=Rugosimonospora africana TaxID=556532 RepID=A0A8J3QW00_9ACTN|nr:hypothetical protein [Rugosimonospora africana]GIH17062.1 hypothetical protein Raf01_52340 [Rugosimonospora africana]
MKRQDMTGTAVTILRAIEIGDMAGAYVATPEAPEQLTALVGLLAGWVANLGPQTFGPHEWSAMLADWQPGQNLGDPPRHDYLMPHDSRYPDDDVRHCPPNCPRLRWAQAHGGV